MPGQNCWDNGPFLAKAFASYALLYNDLPWFCGVHPAGSTRISRLLQGIEFLDIPTEGGVPHLVTSVHPHSMYGFTDGEPKRGQCKSVKCKAPFGDDPMRKKDQNRKHTHTHARARARTHVGIRTHMHTDNDKDEYGRGLRSMSVPRLYTAILPPLLLDAECGCI